MSFSTTRVTIGHTTKKSDADRLMDNDIYLKAYSESFRNTKSTSSDYTILDDDGYAVILVTTGAADKTITLPTVAANDERQLKILKVDDGAGKVIVDGEGAETINGTTTWEITEQYGYVEIISNASVWFVLNQWGCIYELWNNTNYNLTAAWVDYYNLAEFVPGKYLIEYGINLKSEAYSVHATIATAVDTENDEKYTLYVNNNTGILRVFLSKSFIREFASSTTLYLNAKEVTSGGEIVNGEGFPDGYIRATRIG